MWLNQELHRYRRTSALDMRAEIIISSRDTSLPRIITRCYVPSLYPGIPHCWGKLRACPSIAEARTETRRMAYSGELGLTNFGIVSTGTSNDVRYLVS